MRALRPRLAGPELALAGLGAALTVAAAYASVRLGAEIGLGALLVVLLFVVSVVGFLAVPHVAVSATIVLFALIPALKVFGGPIVGPSKDLVTVAAVFAGLMLFAFGDRQRRPDRVVLGLVGLLLVFYVINVGGTGHGIAWAQGLRLIAEPLLLLLVGLILPQPRRTLRWALWTLIVTACLAAAYGLVQQYVGQDTLVAWGYQYNKQVRTISGTLRSFGTFDESFDYATYLLFGIAAVVFWLRRGQVAGGALVLLLLGLVFAFERTSVLIVVAFAGLLLARRGHIPAGALLVAGTLLAAAPLLVNSGGSETKSYKIRTRHGTQTQSAQTGNLLLNGRISAWQAALGKQPQEWLFGRGVARVGTGAERATYTIAPPTDTTGAGTQQSQAVDSGYLATIADVGLVGLVVLLALLGRLVSLGVAATRQDSSAGWVALGLLATLLLDALTRSSFTGFPTAFLCLLLVGLALAAARESTTPSPGT